MGQTAILALPYPDPSDPADGPAAFQALAEAVEAALPRGEVGYEDVTSTSQTTTSSTETDITGGLAVTATLSTSRKYKATLFVRAFSTVDGDGILLRLREGSTDRVGGQFRLSSAASLHATCILIWRFVPASSGSVTITPRFSRVVGSGTVSLVASSTTPMFLLLEDIGPA